MRAHRLYESMESRNDLYERFFSREAPRLADACLAMSQRFADGGTLLAFGKGPYSTDAQHVSVEFVHPVIVGKRALAAADLSQLFLPWLEANLTANDIVMGFGPPAGDPDVEAGLELAMSRGAFTFALPGKQGNYRLEPVTDEPFPHQELIEMLYHVLWESVHVFFEHRELGQDLGATSFLYPFLAQEKQPTGALTVRVAESILAKVAEDAALRLQTAQEQEPALLAAVVAARTNLNRGGRLLVCGNGGSATDANDLVFDCLQPPKNLRPVPALSLSLEPAILSALSNDVGVEVAFTRQIMAQAREYDTLIVFSTSGGSKNIVAALAEARRRHLTTIAFLGYDGGEIVRANLADHAIVIRSDYIPRIQEVQASMYHLFRELLDESDPF